MKNLPCPCDPAHEYITCCQPLHRGQPADNAEALMRSRYSAYVLRLEDYLQVTWHETTCPQAPILPPVGQVKWLRLKVESSRQLDDVNAQVTFCVRYIEAGRHGQMRETSRFVKENGRWLYWDGEIE